MGAVELTAADVTGSGAKERLPPVTADR